MYSLADDTCNDLPDVTEIKAVLALRRIAATHHLIAVTDGTLFSGRNDIALSPTITPR